MDSFYSKIKLCSIDFLDIGCSGNLDNKWFPILSFINYTGFDPNQEECERLINLSNKYKTAKYLPYAIAGEEGEKKIYKTKSIYCSSLLRPNHKWLSRFIYYDLFTEIGRDSVSCVTLDYLVCKKNIKADIIKLDTQGLELPILKMGSKILKNVICVETETGFLENYVGETTYSQIDEFMRENGFLMFDMKIRKVGRRNFLSECGEHQPMWCEAIWLYDFIGQKRKCSEKQAIKSLAICRALRLYDYGFELASYFRDAGILDTIIFEYLNNQKTWEPSLWQRFFQNYFPQKARNKWKKIIKKDLPSFIIFKTRDTFHSLIANDIEFFKVNHILKTKEFKQADVIHVHNLHGNYFNLNLLEKISRIKPVVWTLHDMWALTGHCSYSYNCEKWKDGCGDCPDLGIYPPLFWDNTHRLWKKKKEIYNNSKLNIVVPSLWLKEITQKSILKNQNIELIYNGVDLMDLKQHNQIKARKKLNLPLNKKIIMFLAAGGKKDKRKGWFYVEKMIEMYKDILFLCVGGKENEYNKRGNVRYVAYVDSKKGLAEYFSASNIFLFTSLAENFPLVVLEALACGVPIVGFDVGGVKEAIIHKENGYIVQFKDINDLKAGIDYIFSLEIMAKNYKKLYDNISLP